MSSVRIRDVSVRDGRIAYEYDATPDVGRFLADDFVVEYDVDVSEVPAEILVVPLVANLCPVAWAVGADVYVPRADEAFLRALADVREGFETLHPRFARGGTVYAREIVDAGGSASVAGNGPTDAGSAMLFSGGVDSLTTYLRHRDEEPTLISVHGFDIPLDRDDRWDEREAELRAFGDSAGVDNRFVRLNMQSFLDLVQLNAHFGRYYDDNWITSVHHGLGLLGACAPLSVTEGFGTLYIAATHSAGFSHPWGSHPEIDDRVRWATTTVEHDGYELTRQQKLYRIADHVREEDPDLRIRTCSDASGNCGRCEKCARTEVGLLLAGLDPADHGYEFDSASFDYIRGRFEAGDWHLGADERFMWRDIQSHVEVDGGREYPYEGAREFFAWLRDADVDALAARSTDADSTDSMRNRAVYAVARHAPYPVYSRLYSAVSSIGERLSG